jgi:hypothetical protein
MVSNELKKMDSENNNSINEKNSMNITIRNVTAKNIKNTLLFVFSFGIYFLMKYIQK